MLAAFPFIDLAGAAVFVSVRERNDHVVNAWIVSCLQWRGRKGLGFVPGCSADVSVGRIDSVDHFRASFLGQTVDRVYDVRVGPPVELY